MFPSHPPSLICQLNIYLDSKNEAWFRKKTNIFRTPVFLFKTSFRAYSLPFELKIPYDPCGFRGGLPGSRPLINLFEPALNPEALNQISVVRSCRLKTKNGWEGGSFRWVSIGKHAGYSWEWDVLRGFCGRWWWWGDLLFFGFFVNVHWYPVGDRVLCSRKEMDLHQGLKKEGFAGNLSLSDLVCSNFGHSQVLGSWKMLGFFQVLWVLALEVK